MHAAMSQMNTNLSNVVWLCALCINCSLVTTDEWMILFYHLRLAEWRRSSSGMYHVSGEVHDWKCCVQSRCILIAYWAASVVRYAKPSQYRYLLCWTLSLTISLALANSIHNHNVLLIYLTNQHYLALCLLNKPRWCHTSLDQSAAWCKRLST